MSNYKHVRKSYNYKNFNRYSEYKINTIIKTWMWKVNCRAFKFQRLAYSNTACLLTIFSFSKDIVYKKLRLTSNICSQLDCPVAIELQCKRFDCNFQIDYIGQDWQCRILAALQRVGSVI